MVLTRAQNLASETNGLFADLPADVWDKICEGLGFLGVAAENTNKLFLKNLRRSRTALKLPKMYACRFNGVIVEGRYSSKLYAALLCELVDRYPNLRVLDATVIWEGRLSYGSDTDVIDDVMFNLIRDIDLAPALERVIVKPHCATIVRYMLECVRGVAVDPPLSHDVMAFLAAGNAYGYGANTKVKFTVENEELTNKAHYYAPVRATTPGGSEFEIFYKERGAGLDPVDMEESFAIKHPESAAWGPDGDDLDWEHPEFVAYCDDMEDEMLKGWADDLAHVPFALLLAADSGCDNGCCAIKLVKQGDDFRICSCEQERPVFAKDNDDDLCVCSQDLISPHSACCSE
jgi:hypothetical protein